MVKVASIVALAAAVGSASAFVVQPRSAAVSSRTIRFADAAAEAPPAAAEEAAAAVEEEAEVEAAPAAPPAPAMSKSLPFLLDPPNLKGYVGAEAGFDPLRFSDFFDMKLLREGELKNGRVAMLATLGFVFQEFWTFPWVQHVDDSNLGVQAAGPNGIACLFLSVGFMEWKLNKGKMTALNMWDDGREPGDFGFDPLGFLKGKTQEEIDLMKYKELKHGRLAMLAIGGMIHHNFVTGEPLL